MELQVAQKLIDKWITTYGIDYFDPLTNLGILTEEVGEVARLMVRIHGQQSFKRKEDELHAASQLADEMADVLFVLICLANQCEIDLSSALEKNIEKKTKRDQDRHASNPKLNQ